MIRRGFTVVELVITITIMGILLTLAVVSLNTSQANARDAERKADAESIALHLESFYTTTDSALTQSGNVYPGMSALSDAAIYTTLPTLDTKSTHAPDVDLEDPISIVSATNTSESVDGVTPQPDGTTYVYQALKSDGTLCDAPTETDYEAGECRKFNLYYYQETTDSISVIRSKHQ